MTNFPTVFQKKMLWNAVTGISLLILGALIVGAIWLIINIIALLQPVLIPVAVAGVIAYLLEPVVHKLCQRGFSRMKSVIIVFVGATLIIGGISAVVIPKTIEQGSKLVENRATIIERTKEEFIKWGEAHNDSGLVQWFKPVIDKESGDELPSAAETWLRDNASRITDGAWAVLSSGLQGAGAFFGILLGIFLIPIYLWFFLIEADPIKKQWHNYIPMRASKMKDEIVSCLSEINDYLIAFFRGQMLVSMIDGVLVGITLLAVGLPYALLIGFFVGILGLIPYLGNLMCLIPAMLIALAHFSVPNNQWGWVGDQVWMYPLIIAGIFFVVQQINGFVTAPKIVGDSVGLHPMTVIFSVVVGSLINKGILGAILAVPLTAAVKVLFRRYIWERRLNREPDAPLTA